MLAALSLIAIASALALPALSDPPTTGVTPSATILPVQAAKAVLVKNFGRLPLSFESNQGQINPKVRFLARIDEGSLFLTPSEAVFSMPDQSFALRKKGRLPHATEKRTRVALRMQMVGANTRATAIMQQPLSGRINYLIGSNRGKWHTGVPTFGRAGFQEVYKGIDLVYYGNQRHLEYDFIVAPHADPKQIHLRFAGAQLISVNGVGDLIVQMQGRALVWRKPLVYQQDATGKHAVAAHFRLRRLPNKQNDVRFALGRYNVSRPLVIDPVLLYSTYFGGSVGTGGNCVAVDNSGSAYIAGSCNTADFPTTAGAYQETSPSLASAYVAKFNASGTALVYSTLLGDRSQGGSGLIWGIAADSAGNAYVSGGIFATDFPTTPNAFQSVNHGYPSASGFVAKLNSTGTDLIYATYLGGKGWDEARNIVIDNVGNAYVTGNAFSTDFPTTLGTFQTAKPARASSSPFVTKLNPSGTALVYSTYLGGTGSGPGDPGGEIDKAFSVAIDSSGNAYVAGYACSLDFPVTPVAFQTVNHRKAGVVASNGFVTKLNATGTALLYSTFLGGSNSDSAYALAVDGDGNAYITGTATSTDFPTTPDTLRATPSAAPIGFVAKLNPTGTGLVYSALLGGGGGSTYGVIPSAIVLDSARNAYLTGYTDISDFPTTIGAFQRVRPAGAVTTAFVMKLNINGTAMTCSTFLGGSNGPIGGYGDQATGIAIDSVGNAYITGATSSTDFPVTPGAFQTSNHAAAGYNNTFLTKLAPVPVFPDFNNDNFTDLLIQNTSSNVIASWFMRGSTWISGAYFSLTPPADYALVGVGDFSGNGATTLVLQNRTTNQIAFWYTSGTNNAVIPGGSFVNTTPPTGWKVVSVGEFNGDGKSDLVLQNQTTNQIAFWFMNGSLYLGGVLMPFTPPAGWAIAGAGDLNLDGWTDLVFQNQATGQIALWYMNGTTYVGGSVLTTVPASGWKVVGVGDYNGDGFADLLFQSQTSNQAAVWYLKNGGFVGGDLLSLTPPPGWKIVGPR
jgi:hypothetical protein